MSNHSGSVFNNSCLKMPRNPKSKHPLPVYEQKFINDLENKVRKLSVESVESIRARDNSSEDSDKETLKSFIEFYDSIPEYDDVNHLSSKDFYRKLENIKEKQKSYNEFLRNQLKFRNKDVEWINHYKKLNSEQNDKINEKKGNDISFCTTPILNKALNLDDVDSVLSSDKEITPHKPPSRRSVRIETPSEKFSPDEGLEIDRPKSRAQSASNNNSRLSNWFWDKCDALDTDREPNSFTKSAPNSPKRTKTPSGGNSDGIRIPKPFQMTIRDEENKIIDEVLINNKHPLVKSSNENQQEMFRAHPIPIESQIPLYDKIVADQERRSILVREKRKAELQSKMRPFSFTRRDEEIQALTKALSKSSPSILLGEQKKSKTFKAKPIPRNLFSNYVYQKMQEDEFYRALQKKVRAEEMLKAASLPPSMEKREKNKGKFDVCPRSYRDLDRGETGKKVRTKKRKKFSIDNQEMLELLNQEFEDCHFQTFSPYSFKYSSGKRSNKKKKNRRYSASSKSSDEKTCSSNSLPSLSRSNLAAVLRIESARKRLEMDMCKKLEEARLKDEARWKEKVMRMKPIWQTLAFSNEEDLAMRLQLRRDEERLRNEEHKDMMHRMMGRVYRQPTLFERQSHQSDYPKELDIPSHRCESGRSKNIPKRSISDLSGKHPKKKDEAIQAYLEDYFKCPSDLEGSKASSSEYKEKSESCNTEET